MAKVQSQGSDLNIGGGNKVVGPTITGREYALIRVVREQQVVISALRHSPNVPASRPTTVVDGVLSGSILLSQI